jgi:hypothetical protein
MSEPHNYELNLNSNGTSIIESFIDTAYEVGREYMWNILRLSSVREETFAIYFSKLFSFEVMMII